METLKKYNDIEKTAQKTQKIIQEKLSFIEKRIQSLNEANLNINSKVRVITAIREIIINEIYQLKIYEKSINQSFIATYLNTHQAVVSGSIKKLSDTNQYNFLYYYIYPLFMDDKLFNAFLNEDSIKTIEYLLIKLKEDDHTFMVKKKDVIVDNLKSLKQLLENSNNKKIKELDICRILKNIRDLINGDTIFFIQMIFIKKYNKLITRYIK